MKNNKHKPDYLIIDWFQEGHREYYLQEIDEYLIKNDKTAILLLPRCKYKKFKNISIQFFDHSHNLSRNTYEFIIKKFLIIQSMMKKINSRTTIIFLYADPILISLILFYIFNLLKKINSIGILFMPTIHYSKLFKTDIRVGFRLKGYIKHVLVKILAIFGLKFFTHDKEYSKYTNNNVKFLEVFCPVDRFLNNLPKYTPQEWKKSKNRILAFGYIEKRKGFTYLLKALSENKIKDAHVLILGKIEKILEKEMNNYNEKLENVNIINKYVNNNDIAKYVYNCDKIYAGYDKHLGSSGVFTWAKLFNKKIIVLNWGLLGRQAKSFKNSALIKDLSTKTIIDALSKKNLKREKFKEEIILNNQPKKKFADKLLNYN